MFYILQILALLVLSYAILSKIKNNYLSVILSILLGLLITMEILSFYLSGSLVDYRFYTHANIDIFTDQVNMFLHLILIFSGIFIFITLALYEFSKRFFLKKIYFMIICVCCLAFLFLPKGVFAEFVQLRKIIFAQQENFNEALKNLNISSYVEKDKLKAKSGKNIIVISLESFEYGFLSKFFDNLAPNLKKLLEDWTFYKMNMSSGSTWTSGSLYAHQVGVPAFYPEQELFLNMTDSSLVGLGNILKKANYQSKYIMPGKEFQGMDDFLETYQLEAISEQNSIKIYQHATWGMYDFDVFNEAKLQIKELLKVKDKPFALFVSSISTHPPSGIYDKRMEKYIPKRESNFEFTINTADYLVNDFLNFIKENNLMENTSIYIFPDHLLMSSGRQEIMDKLHKQKRYLYLITNEKASKLGKSPDETLYQIELPKMIINGSGIQTNAVFLADFIKGNIDEFITKNESKISSLNYAAIKKENFSKGLNIELKDLNLYIKTKNFQRKINRKFYPNEETIIDIKFTKSMVYLEDYIVTKENAFTNNDKSPHLLVFIKNSKIIKTYLGNKENIGIYKNANNAYSKKEISNLTNSINLYQENAQISHSIKSDKNTIIARSSEKITSKKYPSYIKFKNKTYGLERGLNLLSIEANNTINFQQFDTFGSEKEADDFIKAIQKTIKESKSWVLVSEDALNSNWPNFKQSLHQLGFKILPNLNWRVAYIAYSKEDKIIHEDHSLTTLVYAISTQD